jgi:hypothetical protein
MNKNIKNKIKIDPSLLATDIQSSCISYARQQDDHGYLVKNNQSFCCCDSQLCNENVVFSVDRNPYEVFASSSSNIGRPSTSPSLINHKTTSTNFDHSQITIPIVLISLFVIISIILIFLLRKKIYSLILKQKNKNSSTTPVTTDQHQLEPFIIDNRGNPLNNNSSYSPVNLIPNEESQRNNRDQNLSRINNKNNDNDKIQQITNFLKSNIMSQQYDSNYNNSNNMMQMEPLLPRGPITNVNKNNEIITSPESIKRFNKQRRDSDFSKDSDIVEGQLPDRLKASDLTLINEIAHGHLSNVWRGRTKNWQPDEIEFAVKVFTSSQRNFWLNERNIYTSLLGGHNNILKYFSVDKINGADSFSNEYWLMTEYQENGSLCDYLKKNTLSLPQMIGLAQGLLDGLSFLHSEMNENDGHKPFFIAHRDLKSKNILVKKNGYSCCIGDFGLALTLTNGCSFSSDFRNQVIFK